MKLLFALKQKLRGGYRFFASLLRFRLLEDSRKEEKIDHVIENSDGLDFKLQVTILTVV